MMTNGYNGFRTAKRRQALNAAEQERLDFVANSVLQSRVGWIDKLLDNRHKIDEECDYPPTGMLSPEYYRELIDRDPAASRAVQLLPVECWQGSPSVYEDERPSKVTDFEEGWDDMCNSLNPAAHSWHQDESGSPLWDELRTADILSRYGQFGIMLMAIDDGRNLQDPADGTEIVANVRLNGKRARVLIPDSPYDAKLEETLRSGWERTAIFDTNWSHGDPPETRKFAGLTDLPPCAYTANVGFQDEQGRMVLPRPNEPEEMLVEAAVWNGQRIEGGPKWLIVNAEKGALCQNYYKRPSVESLGFEYKPEGNTLGSAADWGLGTSGSPPAQGTLDDLALNLAVKSQSAGRDDDPERIKLWLQDIPVGETSDWAPGLLANQFMAGPEDILVPNARGNRADRGSAPGNGAFIQGIKRDNPTTWSIQGTDQQYSTGYGIGMAPPLGSAGQYTGGGAGSTPQKTGADPASLRSSGGSLTSWVPSLSGTDQQYFGVQFGPSEKASDKPAKKQRRLLFLRSYDESLVQIVRYEWNIRNPRFGLPVMYRVTLNDPRLPHSGVGLPLATVYVHWSRIIHLTDSNQGPSSSKIFSPPTLQPILNSILDCRKMRAASGESVWQSCFAGISLETNPQMGGDVLVDKPATRAMMREYRERLQRDLMLIGMQAKTLPPQVIDPTPHYTIAENSITTKLGVPMRIWRGAERGELASTQDDENWNQRKRERQLNYMTPRIIVPFVDRLIQIGVLPEPKVSATENLDYLRWKHSKAIKGDLRGLTANQARHWQIRDIVEHKSGRGWIVTNADGSVKNVMGGYSVEWPDLDALGDTDKATICSTNTTSLAAYVQAGGAQTGIAMKTFLTSEKFLGMDEEEAEAVMDEADKAQEEQMQEQQDQADEQGWEQQPPDGFQKEGQGEDQPLTAGPGESLVHPDDVQPGKPFVSPHKPVAGAPSAPGGPPKPPQKPQPSKQEDKIAGLAKAQAKQQGEV